VAIEILSRSERFELDRLGISAQRIPHFAQIF